MKLQLLSDLHLETERFDPRPAPGADLLVLAGDIDATWQGFAHFVGWPVPVIFVPGNHEYDDGDLDETAPALRALTSSRSAASACATTAFAPFSTQPSPLRSARAATRASS